MRRSLALAILPLAAAATLGVTAVASAAPPGVSSTTLNGANEVPGPGDPDGIGSAVVLPKPAQPAVCISIRYAGIATPPTGAHIHQGSPTVAGPIVVDFTPLVASSPPGTVRGCVATTADLARNIAQNPTDFYVNVHNAAFPAGAIRGQLAPGT